MESSNDIVLITEALMYRDEIHILVNQTTEFMSSIDDYNREQR